jgi:hypothetical protein
VRDPPGPFGAEQRYTGDLPPGGRITLKGNDVEVYALFDRCRSFHDAVYLRRLDALDDVVGVAVVQLGGPARAAPGT